ncbi:MAG: prolyl oligopeptidase family serine peptidase [Candidatus Zixiibacteriota bacterium]
MKGKAPRTRVDDVVEIIHGQRVDDPYRWLEDSESPEVKSWVEEQNGYTRSVLDSLPDRKKIRSRLEELLSIGYLGAPQVCKGRYFYTKREGQQNQPVLYLREGLNGKERILIDPNSLSHEGLVALDWWFPSDDGKVLAYGLSQEGNEQSTLYVMNTETKEKLSDVISRTRYSSVAWKKDNTGFYYTRYPEPGRVPKGEEDYHQHLFYHALGTDPDRDPKVFGEGRDMTEMYGVSLSPDNHYLLLSIFKGWDKSDVYFQNLQSSPGIAQPDQFVPIAVGEDALFSGQIVGDILYLHTNYQAPKYRLLKVDLRTPARENWKELIPEDKSVLQQVVVVGNRLVTQYMENASSRLRIFSSSGEHLQDPQLPTLGSVYGLNGEWDGSEALFGFESYFIPPTIYRYDLRADTLGRIDQVRSHIDTSPYQVEQIWYQSKDQSRISMFVVHQKEIKLDRNNPVFLTGYGGFNVSQTPYFQRSILFWLENGGIYAVPNLRGGSEYGEEWHKAGMLERKQNVFDDFVAAAEWLISNGYTSPNRLVISGGSNGGLLMGAALTQRPDLFKAVICANPLLDMIRYHKFLIAKLWIPEYGSSDDSVQFKWLYAYSPYHRVRDGTPYPATLLLTADSDTRVDPLHAEKMAARLQAATSSDAPILLRFETKAGHGAGTPLSKSIEEYTDIWSFVFWQLGIWCRSSE